MYKILGSEVVLRLLTFCCFQRNSQTYNYGKISWFGSFCVLLLHTPLRCSILVSLGFVYLRFFYHFEEDTRSTTSCTEATSFIQRTIYVSNCGLLRRNCIFIYVYLVGAINTWETLVLNFLIYYLPLSISAGCRVSSISSVRVDFTYVVVNTFSPHQKPYN